MSLYLISLLLSIVCVEAHFRIPIPGERNATNWATQLTGPCGGANEVVLPRFKWNPSGSPIELFMHHPFAIGAIYYCNKDNCTETEDFDQLIYEPFDTKGAGNFCISALTLPDEFNVEGDVGTLQVIFGGTSEVGEYDFMYNCLDIVIDSNGETYDDVPSCDNSTVTTYDEQVDELVKNGTKIDEITQFDYLDELEESAESAASASSAASEMGGMDGMSGMDGMPGMGGMSSTASDSMGDMSGMSGMAGMSGMDGMTGMDGMSGMGVTTSVDSTTEKGSSMTMSTVTRSSASNSTTSSTTSSKNGSNALINPISITFIISLFSALLI